MGTRRKFRRDVGRGPVPSASHPGHQSKYLRQISIDESLLTGRHSTVHSPSNKNHHRDFITEQMRKLSSDWFGLSDDEEDDDDDNGDSKSEFAYSDDEYSVTSVTG